MYCLFPSRPLFILSEAKNEERAGSRKPEAGSRKLESQQPTASQRLIILHLIVSIPFLSASHPL